MKRDGKHVEIGAMREMIARERERESEKGFEVSSKREKIAEVATPGLEDCCHRHGRE